MVLDRQRPKRRSIKCSMVVNLLHSHCRAPAAAAAMVAESKTATCMATIAELKLSIGESLMVIQFHIKALKLC